MSAPLQDVLQRAVAEGVLTDATLPEHNDPPWPVVVMTAIGAWIAAVPLCLLVGMLMLPILEASAGSYLAGAIVFGASLMALVQARVPLFVEQLAIPGLLVGGGLLVFSLFRDTAPAAACFGGAILSLFAAALIPTAWLRTLLGVLAAQWTGAALLVASDVRWSDDMAIAAWWVVHLLLAPWIAALALQRTCSAPVAEAVEAIGTGWLVVLLGSLAWLTGATFMVGSLGAPVSSTMSRGQFGLAASAVSALLALAACGWMARQWPGLRKLALVAVPAVLVPLAWTMPALGAVLLATALCAGSSRWRQAAVGCVAAAWIIGAFYYQLSWTLMTKAHVMVFAGVALGAAAWQLRPASVAQAAPTDAGGPWTAPRVLAAVTVVLTLLVANVGIWQKQQLIAHGRVVLVPLQPVDPRSIMQGDYMALDFMALRRGVDDRADGKPVAVLTLDERGVATRVTFDETGGSVPLNANELRVQLVYKSGSWVLVTDAWHFAEGQGERFAAARFGEFRVMDDGRALLVGMRDADLRAIEP